MEPERKFERFGLKNSVSSVAEVGLPRVSIFLIGLALTSALQRFFYTLSPHNLIHGCAGEWVYDVEYHGKSPSDGVGAAVNTILDKICCAFNKEYNAKFVVQNCPRLPESGALGAAIVSSLTALYA